MDTSMTTARSLDIQVVVQGPGAVATELAAAGFFELIENEVLIGGAKQLNDGVNGKVMEYRTDGSFLGNVGETFLFIPEKNTIPAARVLLVGLGNREGISLDIVRTAAILALEKANELGLTNFAFAPEIRDAGVTTLGAGAVAQAVSEAMLQRFKELVKSKTVTVTTCFMLAGKAHEADALAGVQNAKDKSATG
jgi:Cytosol aminopeptidase family, N-terminal domain